MGDLHPFTRPKAIGQFNFFFLFVCDGSLSLSHLSLSLSLSLFIYIFFFFFFFFFFFWMCLCVCVCVCVCVIFFLFFFFLCLTWLHRIALLSAHACAIPAIMSTRVIEDRRDRLATIMVIPLMSCSARVPVYVDGDGADVSARRR